MTRSSARLAGLAGAASLVAAIALLMILLDRWDWEVLAIATMLSSPLYLAARDAAANRQPRPAWVPPWERTLATTRFKP